MFVLPGRGSRGIVVQLLCRSLLGSPLLRLQAAEASLNSPAIFRFSTAIMNHSCDFENLYARHEL